jgi:Phage integrase family
MSWTGLFSDPISDNRKIQSPRGAMHPDTINRVLRKHTKALGLDRGYSAHSMRATFITTAPENGGDPEDVQRAVGHREPSTTKLYNRRGYNPDKSASLGHRHWLHCPVRRPASTEIILGHELGHSAHPHDDGPGNRGNVNENENPIRHDLGLPDRTRYEPAPDNPQ